jgi:hypothetical protein
MSKILLQNRKLIIILIIVASLLPGCIGSILMGGDLLGLMKLTTSPTDTLGDPQVKALKDALENISLTVTSPGN